jgi:hypothetical protein
MIHNLDLDMIVSAKRCRERDQEQVGLAGPIFLPKKGGDQSDNSRLTARLG